jgi:hypothetical protein
LREVWSKIVSSNKNPRHYSGRVEGYVLGFLASRKICESKLTSKLERELQVWLPYFLRTTSVGGLFVIGDKLLGGLKHLLRCDVVWRNLK